MFSRQTFEQNTYNLFEILTDILNLSQGMEEKDLLT